AQLFVDFCPKTLGDAEAEVRIAYATSELGEASVPVALLGRGGGPDIGLPLGVDWGLGAIGIPVTRTLQLRNDGIAPLVVDELLLSGEGFRSRDPGAQILEPGEVAEIELIFEPLREGPLEGRLLLTSNDQDEALREVVLRGEGRNFPPPCPAKVPDRSLYFGDVEPGRSLRLGLKLSNIEGPSACLVDVQLPPGPFRLADGERPQRVLPPQTDEIIGLEFTPPEEGAFEAMLTLGLSNLADPRRAIKLRGRGQRHLPRVVPRQLDFGRRGPGRGHVARDLFIQAGNSAGEFLPADTRGQNGAELQQLRTSTPLVRTSILPPIQLPYRRSLQTGWTSWFRKQAP
ncbi:MAG: hypothetical protein AAGD10_21570, partial [Myxococcota bacterium]